MYSPLLLLAFLESMDATALETSVLAATMADDDSDKDSGPVGCGSLTLSFTIKYLYNDISAKSRIKMSAKIKENLKSHDSTELY